MFSVVAQSVVKHDQHILNGATLHVSLELLDNAENTSKTIQITGLTAQSTEDSIRNYFENERRSGGGEVEVVIFRPEENVAFVTFKDVDGKSLHYKLHFAFKSSKGCSYHTLEKMKNWRIYSAQFRVGSITLRTIWLCPSLKWCESQPMVVQ